MGFEIHRSSVAEYRSQIVVSEDRSGDGLASLLAAAVIQVADDTTQLWIRHVADADDAVADRFGFEPYRDLWQLRCPLPADPSGLPTRSFTLGDLEEFVAVNNRAFHWHPEQGRLTSDAVRRQMDESWFDADGFRLHHREGRLAGFCWTKIHPEHDPPLGEIYVIAIDPDFHGHGLGAPMTLAGLEWLAAQGLRHGMLYVESDNHPANAVYAKIGFERHHTDRAYRRGSAA